MKLQDLQKLHPDGHDFRICSRETKRHGDFIYFKSIWVEWIKAGKPEWREISELNISYLDNEYSFELAD